MWKAEAFVNSRLWFFELGTVLMCLVVGDGALWLSGVGQEGDDVGRERVVRVLATFVFLGMIEPVWRNVSFSLVSGRPGFKVLLYHYVCVYTDGRGEEKRRKNKGEEMYLIYHIYMRMLMERGEMNSGQISKCATWESARGERHVPALRTS